MTSIDNILSLGHPLGQSRPYNLNCGQEDNQPFNHVIIEGYARNVLLWNNNKYITHVCRPPYTPILELMLAEQACLRKRALVTPTAVNR